MPTSTPPTHIPNRPPNPTPYSIRNLIPAPLFSPPSPSPSTASSAPLRRRRRPSPEPLSLSPSRSRALPNINHYHRISIQPARGSTPAKVQYWISADDVLGDRLAETNVPKGHWARLVQLARTACGGRQGASGEVRILTAWYCPDGDGKVEMAVETQLSDEE